MGGQEELGGPRDGRVALRTTGGAREWTPLRRRASPARRRDPTIPRRPGAVENGVRSGTERRSGPFTFRPLPVPFPLRLLGSDFSPPTSGLLLPRVTGGMKTREAGRRGGRRGWGRDFLGTIANGGRGRGFGCGPAEGEFQAPWLNRLGSESLSGLLREVKRGAAWRSNREQKRCVSFLRAPGTETTKRERDREGVEERHQDAAKENGREESPYRERLGEGKVQLWLWRGTPERSLRKFPEGCCPLLSVV